MIFSLVVEVYFLSKDLRYTHNSTSLNKIDIEFTNSKTYTITQEKIQNILVADKIQQLKTKKIFINPIATIYDTNITKTIISKKAILDDKTSKIKLLHDVHIVYLDKTLNTQMLLYDIKSEKVIDSANFLLTSDDIQAKGVHLFFDTKKNILKAKKIQYNFKQSE